MNATKKMKGIIILGKEKLDIAIVGISTIESLPFPPNVVRSMEVIDKVALTTLVKNFIVAKKIPPTSFSLILHDSLLFEKLIDTTPKTPAAKPSVVPTQSSLPTPISTVQLSQPEGSQDKSLSTATHSEEDEENQIQQFTESIPFEEVLVKTMKTVQGKLIIVANKELVTSISEAFEANAMTVDQVIAVTQLGKDISLTGGITPAISQLLFAKVDAYRGQSMLPDPQPVTAGPVELGMPQKESDKKRLVLMVGVFIILIIVLVFAYMNMQAQNASINTSKQIPTAPVEQTPLVEVTPTGTASSSADMKLSYPIELQGVLNNASSAALLDTALREAGYQAITTKQSGTEAPATMVSFTNDVPFDIQQELIQLVSAIDSDVLVQDNTTETTKIIITVK